MENRASNQADFLNRIIRSIILIIVSLMLSVFAVSFTVHHMRLQFEEEFKTISNDKISSVCDVVRRTLNGDEIAEDPQGAAVKYDNVLSLMLADTSTKSYSSESYGLFLYSDGRLSVLMNRGPEAPEAFEVASKDISDWLNANNEPTTIYGDNSESLLVPVADSTGRCVAVFEYKCNFNNLKVMGDEFEGRILKAVIITVCAGIFVYILQLFIPKIVQRSRNGKGVQRL
ncbi:MAG: hypothetical protein IJ757_06775 [Clostridiales bacterium]|nr:hypothetical protein [Clostridiales bacterium]